MNTKTTDKIINTTKQYLADGTTVSLTFYYPANFKIGDTIEVTASEKNMQAIVSQHNEYYFGFDVEIWDDCFRLQCDSMKQLGLTDKNEMRYSFKIREIELFANSFSALKKAIA